MSHIQWERYPSVAGLLQARTWLQIQHDLGLAQNTVEAYGRAETQRLASVNVWKATQDGDEVTFPRCFEPGYGITGVFSMVGHPLYDTL